MTTVAADGSARVRAATATTGYALSDGALIFGRPGPAPTAALPWSLHHAAAVAGVERLRAEVGEVSTGIDPALRELVVLQAATGGAAKELLRVDAAKTTTIPGPLTVKGTITMRGGGPAGAVPDFVQLAQASAALLAQAQQLLARQADKDLTVVAQGAPSVSAGTLHYDFQLVSAPGVAAPHRRGSRIHGERVRRNRGRSGAWSGPQCRFGWAP